MNWTRAARAVPAAVCGTGLLVALAGPAGAQEDPAGNNGTVKIDRVPFDDHPNNEPHVGCEFQVDFYGFDEGDLSATVTFEAVPPTQSGATDVPPGEGDELLTDEVAIGQDAAGGGTDLDASVTYDLTDELAGIEPHPQQGWHVRLTVHAEGSQGADTKHKVFWVSGCEPTTTTSSSTTSTSTTSTSTTSTSTTTTRPDEPGNPDNPGGPGGDTPPTSAPDTGVSPAAPGSMSPASDDDTLPITGSNTVPLAVGASALIAFGVAGVLGARRLRAARG
jgi:hypothetical protein